jgi:hypothetical protein
MHESDTYLEILEEGEKMGHREGLLIVGEELWGPPGDLVKNQLNHIADLDRLRRMSRRALRVANWQEMLETP